MSRARKKQIWGLHGREARKAPVVRTAREEKARQRVKENMRLLRKRRSPSAQKERSPWWNEPQWKCRREAQRIDRLRERFKYSFKSYYNEVVADDMRDPRTKVMRKRALGRFHDFLIDFNNLHQIEEVETYSPIATLLPERKPNGDFKERWLYWRTLDGAPEIQDGAVGAISTMFYDSATIWQGIVVRICGDGLTKLELAPRNHLKSSLAIAMTGWSILREPNRRRVIRSSVSKNAAKFMKGIKAPFETNFKFKELWGHLKPDPREEVWSNEEMQVRCQPRRGVSPTVESMGMETEAVGLHGDEYNLDDVVGETNCTATILEGVRATVQGMQAQRDPFSVFTVRGTRWDESDPYSMFVGKPGANEFYGTLAPISCFFVATVLDGDQSVKVSTNLSPLGYGKPIWPEERGLRWLENFRYGTPWDWFYFGQMFNQFTGTTSRVFNRAWIRQVPETWTGQHWEREVEQKTSLFLGGMSMVELAIRLRLHIRFAVDSASGKDRQKPFHDHTAGLVIGQTPDKRYKFVLDGFKEKLPAIYIGKAIVGMATKWYSIARRYGGTFRSGFEDIVYTHFLSLLLIEEQKKLGVESLFSIERIEHENRSKVSRIEVLAPQYRDGVYFWPKEMIVPAILPGAPQYDLIGALNAEFVAYHPTATMDHLLDAHAYADQLCIPTDYWRPPEAAKPLAQNRKAVYSRASVQNQRDYLSLSGFDVPERVNL